MTSYTCFNVETANKIAHIQLKRPEAYNSMIRAFWTELPEIVRKIDDEGTARVIVVSSTGKHFCSGMDLSVFTDGQGTTQASAKLESGRAKANFRIHVRRLQETFSCMDEARMPVLMAIQGGCIGGAVDMSTCADIRYATRDAFFTIQEINLAMTADVGTFPRLCHLLPQGLVRELAYTGRRLSAEEAHRHGLVTRVYDDHEALIKGTFETATEIASKSPLAVHGSKVMINYARDHSIEDGLDYIATWQTGMYNPQVDMMESFKAKAEKREPVYDDLPPLRKGL